MVSIFKEAVEESISNCITNDLIKLIDEEFSVELDYLICKHNVFSFDCAIKHLQHLTLILSDRAEDFFKNRYIYRTHFDSITMYISEKFHNSEHFLKSIVYNESEESDNEENNRPMAKSHDGRVRRNRRG